MRLSHDNLRHDNNQDKAFMTFHKKWSFPLKISSVNVTKSAGTQLEYLSYLKTIFLEDSLHNDTVLIANTSFKVVLCAFAV